VFFLLRKIQYSITCWKKADSHENSPETILFVPYGFFAEVCKPSKNFPRVSQNDFYVAFKGAQA
jgi:hypothetical protein